MSFCDPYFGFQVVSALYDSVAIVKRWFFDNCSFLRVTVPGENNPVFVPESTHTTYELVKEAHPNQEYDWILIPDYGHLDCWIGRNAVYDVYPYILRALDRHAYDNLHLSEAKLARISQEAVAMQCISGKLSWDFF